MRDRPKPEGRWNFYRCKKCSGFWITVDVSKGVTPATLLCRVGSRGAVVMADLCGGTMVSAGYPEPGKWPDIVPRTVNAEWYRPGEYHRQAIKKKHPALYDHLMNGGLIQRPAPDGAWVFPTTTEEASNG